jgi:uncharacterized protein YbgA (DUF1722 family)
MLRRVKAKRQREIADIMYKSANYTFAFMELLIAASKIGDFNDVKIRTRGVSRNELATIERTFSELENDFRCLAPYYREGTIAFLVSLAYARKFFENENIAKYLRTFYPSHYDNLKHLIQWQSKNAFLGLSDET